MKSYFLPHSRYKMFQLFINIHIFGNFGNCEAAVMPSHFALSETANTAFLNAAPSSTLLTNIPMSRNLQHQKSWLTSGQFYHYPFHLRSQSCGRHVFSCSHLYVPWLYSGWAAWENLQVTLTSCTRNSLRCHTDGSFLGILSYFTFEQLRSTPQLKQQGNKL